ncbi:MAG: selenocysteine-specific translation elongation factor [Desulfobacterales bacterium]
MSIIPNISSEQIILGTAGHIDHGKTTLIKALTGINTDRLKEEQLRGITIELGFAFLDLPSGRHIGIVDVPGHEKFVKNMVAGATGIDLVAMVIAADEGVMPQTREHMEICTLLGVRHGLVVLTKTDMVDEEWLELVTEDIREFVRGTFLEDKPIVPVSGLTGKGIPEFIRTLDSLSAEIPPRSSAGLFRLPADRVFSMKGFGTVITGTLISGQVSVGDSVMLYPSGITSKVRGLQVHGQSVETAFAGMRTAVNFQGLEKSTVNRGDVLSAPDALMPSYMLDVFLHYLAGNKKPVKNRTAVRFHAGTAEILGNLILLENDELAPGESAAAQLRLDTPVALVKDDRFVIRSISPVRTIGGGTVLNPVPRKHKRLKPDVTAKLRALADLPPEQIAACHAGEAGYSGVSLSALRIMSNMPEKQLEKAVQSLLSQKILIQTDRENRIFIHKDSFAAFRQEITEHLEKYHRENPLKNGMSKEELKSRLPSFAGVKLFHLAVAQMLKEEEIAAEGDIVRLKSHQVSLGQDQSAIRKKLLDAYAGSGLTPPYFKELCTSLEMEESQAKDVLMVLVGEGLLVKAKEDLYFFAESVEELKTRLVAWLREKGEISTPEFKDIAGVSRKYLIPLIEYFDSRNITIRIGDIRKLRGG